MNIYVFLHNKWYYLENTYPYDKLELSILNLVCSKWWLKYPKFAASTTKLNHCSSLRGHHVSTCVLRLNQTTVWLVTNISHSSKCCPFPVCWAECLELWTGQNVNLEDVGTGGDKTPLVYKKPTSLNMYNS